jgi:hypothetical protein
MWKNVGKKIQIWHQGTIPFEKPVPHMMTPLRKGSFWDDVKLSGRWRSREETSAETLSNPRSAILLFGNTDMTNLPTC